MDREGIADGLCCPALTVLPFPVCILDEDGQILFQNESMQRTFGSGRKGTGIIPELKALLRDVARSTVPGRGQVSLPVGEGKSVQVPYEVYPLQGPGHDSFRGVAWVALVTGETAPLAEILVRGNSRKKLKELISVIRHDILNQLTILIGFLQYSEDFCQDPQIRDFISREEAAGNAIQSLIELSRSFQDLSLQDPGWQDIPSLVRSAVDRSSPAAVRVEERCGPLEIYASPLVGQVFDTLVKNALSHAKGLSRITFSTREESGDLVLTCEDDGPGIPPGERRMLFERGHGRHAGYGLWLAVEILGISGATIRECGEEGKGARFEIRVPAGLWRWKEGETPEKAK
ncbi:MAG: ATP-binding protein [Methanolinea sp.]|nr:ATP-binding protein [Methanolinea sp.]